MMVGSCWWRSPNALLVSLIFSIALPACSLAVDADRAQCTTKADCTARGSAFANASCINSLCQEDPAWSCLTKAATPSTQSPPYKVTVTVRDVVTQAPVTNAQIKLCRKIDVDCASPAGTQTSDNAGGASFMVEMSGFNGYLLVQAEGALDTLYFFNPGIDHDQAIPPISVATPAENGGLLFALGRQLLPGRGSVVIASQDCTGVPAAGVSYMTMDGDEMTSQFYIAGNAPSGTAMATDALGGYGGIINLKPGYVTIAATLANPRTDLGSINVLIRDSAITYSRIVPIGK
jgi:hypothetical protein